MRILSEKRTIRNLSILIMLYILNILIKHINREWGQSAFPILMTTFLTPFLSVAVMLFFWFTIGRKKVIVTFSLNPPFLSGGRHERC